jgi:hypothetical protein
MMEEQHRSHLASTYTTVLQHLAEIAQVVSEGKTPAGARVTPLPEPQRARLLAILDGLAARLRELVETLVPEWQTASREVGGLAATRMWVSVLLGTVEGLLEDVTPERMSRRYGAMIAADAEDVGRAVNEALRLVRAAMEVGRSKGDGSE